MKKLTLLFLSASCFNLADAGKLTNCVKEGKEHPKDVKEVLAFYYPGRDAHFIVECWFENPLRLDRYKKAAPTNYGTLYAWIVKNDNEWICSPYDQDGEYEPKLCSFEIL